MIQTNLFAKQKYSQTQKTNMPIKWEMGYGRDKLGIWDYQVKTTIYKINNKVLLYNPENFIQYIL